MFYMSAWTTTLKGGILRGHFCQLGKIQIGRIDSKNDYLKFFIILCFIFFCKFPIIIGTVKEIISNIFVICQEYAELTFIFGSFIIPEPFIRSFSAETKFFDRIYIAGRRRMIKNRRNISGVFRLDTRRFLKLISLR